MSALSELTLSSSPRLLCVSRGLQGRSSFFVRGHSSLSTCNGGKPASACYAPAPPWVQVCACSTTIQDTARARAPCKATFKKGERHQPRECGRPQHCQLQAPSIKAGRGLTRPPILCCSAPTTSSATKVRAVYRMLAAGHQEAHVPGCNFWPDAKQTKSTRHCYAPASYQSCSDTAGSRACRLEPLAAV